VGIDPQSPLGSRLVHLVCELVGFPRHLSQHVGGMVLTRGPLCELAPIENAAMPERTVIQWDKDDLDELGILKVDCLCLGMLTAIRKCFALIEQHHGRPLTLAGIPAEDPAVYGMICQADTIGVFQIESRAQMSMLPRLRPNKYYDLVIEVAIVRPGPIQGNMVHPYLRRRSGEEAVPSYPTQEIEKVLSRTLGVPLFQEQAMQLAIVAAGFTPGEADQLRRAMGGWRRPGIIDQFHKKLIDGMTARGLTGEFAQRVFQQIRGFGEYGFPESHAASFALLVYVSAWLKHYYPAMFCAALINSQQMGFYAPAQLIRDARQHGVQVLPVDVNASGWDCTLEGVSDDRQDLALRLGFRVLVGIPSAAVERIVAARLQGAFRSLDDLAHRARLTQAILTRLAEADAFGSLALDRRAALWDALSHEKGIQSRPLLQGLEDDEPRAELPPMPPLEQVLADYRTAGLSLKSHPLAFFREQLGKLRVTPTGELGRMDDGRYLRVAGIVLLRQRPGTARGITFVTLEDETGLANLVIKQAIWERYYRVARRSQVWIAHGRLERKDSIIHLVVSRLDDLSQALGDLRTQSRDFR
jgi:error-prone DNA polymerase